MSIMSQSLSLSVNGSDMSILPPSNANCRRRVLRFLKNPAVRLRLL
jgi:hypothetical protein